MKVLGLTGGICAGKSTITQLLSEVGIPVIDADKLGHQAYTPGTACCQQLIATFGQDIVVPEDGSINRRVLGSIVFGNEEKMNQLKAIVWPEIRRLALLRLEELRAEGKHDLVVLEAAVMIEAQWQDIADIVWVVYTSPETAVKRLMSRNQLSEEDAKSRLNSQLSNEERLQYAHESIENDTKQTIDSLREQVLALLAKIQK